MAVEALAEQAPSTDLIGEIKLSLMAGIDARLREQYRTQEEAADALGLEQPQISRLRNRDLSRFSLPWLVLTAEKLGLRVTVTVE